MSVHSPPSTFHLLSLKGKVLFKHITNNDNKTRRTQIKPQATIIVNVYKLIKGTTGHKYI